MPTWVVVVLLICGVLSFGLFASTLVLMMKVVVLPKVSVALRINVPLVFAFTGSAFGGWITVVSALALGVPAVHAMGAGVLAGLCLCIALAAFSSRHF